MSRFVRQLRIIPEMRYAISLLAIALLSVSTATASEDFRGKSLEVALAELAVQRNGKIVLDVRRADAEEWKRMPEEPALQAFPDVIAGVLNEWGDRVYRIVVIWEYNREHILFLDRGLVILDVSQVHDRVWVPDSGHPSANDDAGLNAQQDDSSERAEQ